MSTQNQTNTLTQRAILSIAFNVEEAGWSGKPNSPQSQLNIPNLYASSNHYQDTVADGIMTKTMGNNSAYGQMTGELSTFNEFELDIESWNHTWQTMTQPLPLPGVARVQGDTGDGANSAQMVALVIDLGLMREIISVQGVLVDRTTHPSSTSGHHIRRQHLLDVARTQWANVHNYNRATGFDWTDPNRLPALTLGPLLGRDTSGSDRDSTYYGQEPSDDPRGLEVFGYTASGQPTTNIIGWDWTFNYKGRRRYRGMIRRLTLTQLSGQPDVWRYNFDFEIVKNELQLRTLT